MLVFAGTPTHGLYAQAGSTPSAPAATESTQAAPATPAATPHGTVLFERHEAPAGDVPTPQATPGTPAAAIPAAGASSSVRRRSTRKGLQRRAVDRDGSATDTAGVETVATDGATAAQAATPPCTAACDPALAGVTDVERNAVHLLESALDLHLNLQTGDTAAHAKLLVRNVSAAPLTRLPLQISASLQWQAGRLGTGSTGTAIALHQHRIVTDADHTGNATELVVLLPQPLLPGATANLDLFYGGALGTSTERLLRLGAPPDRAALSDWDTVSDRFTGLRGFGNVLWLPVAAPVALLGSTGDFVGIADAQRRQNQAGRMSLRLTVETGGPPPGAAFFLGSRQPLVPASSSDVANAMPVAGVSSSSSSAIPTPDDDTGDARLYTAQWAMAPIGAELPSLFVSAAPEQAAALRVATDNAAAAESYGAAADRLRPLMEEWLSPQPARSLDVLDLPLAGAQPFAADSLLVAPLQPAAAKDLAPVLAYPLASAWLPADAAPWLAQGLPELMRLLALERNGNREVAMASIVASLPTLASREAAPDATTFAPSVVPSAGFSSSVSSSAPSSASSPAPSAPPLAQCVDAVCARTKGAYVLTMLRGILGDAPLKQAIAGWAATRANAAGSPQTDTATFERLLQTASGKDLRWLFADWIDRDAGLPELTILNVAPRRIERGTVTNIVPTQRQPVGGPVGPEPVAQPGDPTGPERATAASRNQIGPRDGSWLIAVEVQNNGDAVAEVPVTVRGSGLQNSLPLRIAAHSHATIRVPFETTPEEVTVNDGTTPERRTTVHRRTITVSDTMR